MEGARQALGQQAGLLAGVVHERRAFLPPNAAVFARHLARAHAQDDALEDGLPQERAHLDDSAVGEEFTQERPDGARLGRGRRAQVDQEQRGPGMVGVCAGQEGGGCVPGVRHPSRIVFAERTVPDAVSPHRGGAGRFGAVWALDRLPAAWQGRDRRAAFGGDERGRGLRGGIGVPG